MQKEKHDPQDKENGDEDGENYLTDRFSDESRRIVDDFVIDALRKLFLEVFHRREDLFVDCKGVCPRLCVDQERRRVAAIQVRG